MQDLAEFHAYRRYLEAHRDMIGLLHALLLFSDQSHHYTAAPSEAFLTAHLLTDVNPDRQGSSGQLLLSMLLTPESRSNCRSEAVD